MWYDTIVSNLKTALETIFVKKSDVKDNLTSTDTNKPLSAKQGKNLQDTKQATLVSGTNIKTINNESLLGSGNITIQGGSSVDVVTSWESTLSDSKVPSEKLTKNTLDNKVNTSDIKDNLTSTDNDKPLSANQGVELKALVDGKATTNDIDTKISTHNSDSSAHSTEMAKKLNIAQTSYKGKNVVVDSSSGNITFEDKYSHPSSKQCNYAYTHPSTKQCDASIPTGSSTATDIKMNGTQSAGSSSNYAKADHVHPTDTSRVAVSQGSGNSGKFLKVNSSGNVACESVTIPSAYVHPSEKQCSYSYSHPSSKQCNASIPSASSSTPLADVTGGAIGSSSNYAKADHKHPLSSAYATANHNQNLSTINNVTTMAVVITYTDDTTEIKNFVIYTGS